MLSSITMRETLKCIYVRRKFRIQKSDNIGKMKGREEKSRREEEKELEENRYGARDFRQAVTHRVFTNDLWLGQKKGKVARCRAWISFPSRSDLVQHLVLIPSSLKFSML